MHIFKCSQVVSPGGSVVKNLPTSAGALGSTPGSRKPPGGGNGNQLHSSCLENPMDRGDLQATVHVITRESDRTERLSTHAGCTVQLKCYFEFMIEVLKNIKRQCSRFLWKCHNLASPCYSMEHSYTLRKCHCFINLRHQNPEMCSTSINVFSGKSLTFKWRYKWLFFCTPNWIAVSDIFLNWTRVSFSILLLFDQSSLPSI